MKILQINTEKTWQGGERQTIYTIEGLAEAGVEVGLLCCAGFPLHAKSERLGISLHPVRNTLDAVRFLCTKARQYDVLHPQTSRGQSLAVLTKPFHCRPVLYTRRMSDVPNGFLARMKYRMTDAVVANNRAVQRALGAKGVENVEFIPSAARERELNRKRAKKLLEKIGVEDRIIIATTGDLVPQKDPLTLVEAIYRLHKKRKDFAFLHFGNQQMVDEVRARIDEYGLNDVFFLMGHRSNVEDFYSVFDVYMLCARESEGIASSLMDAFLYKVPVVATRAGGVSDALGQRGLGCDIGDAECLASHVNEILEDPALRKKLVKKARKEVLKEFSIQRMSRAYIKRYSELV